MYEAANESPRFCRNCGGAVVEGSKFCRHCGSDVTLPEASVQANAVQQEVIESSTAPADDYPIRNNRRAALFIGGGLLVIVVLVAVAIAASVLYFRHRNQSAQNIASSSPAVPTMGQKALQIEVKILRGEALTNTDLTGLSAYELRVLRNVHFARYGRKYDRPGLGDYFATREWYKPSDDYNEKMVTAKDKENINLILATEKSIGGTQTDNTSSESTASPASNSNTNVITNEEQARLEVEKLVLGKHLNRCGDSYIGKQSTGVVPEGWYYQYKSPSFVVIRVFPVSEADRLNGVEWHGLVNMNYSAFRKKDYIVGQGLKEWSQWTNNPNTAEWNFNVIKRTSAWSVEDHLVNRLDNRYATIYQKGDCSLVSRP